MRMCAKCPEWTQIVCRHAFGRFWDAKSGSGEGCEHPLDDVAAAWKAAGWRGEAVPILIPRRPARPQVKVSDRIRRQAELFFGRAKT